MDDTDDDDFQPAPSRRGAGAVSSGGPKGKDKATTDDSAAAVGGSSSGSGRSKAKDGSGGSKAKDGGSAAVTCGGWTDIGHYYMAFVGLRPLEQTVQQPAGWLLSFPNCAGSGCTACKKQRHVLRSAVSQARLSEYAIWDVRLTLPPLRQEVLGFRMDDITVRTGHWLHDQWDSERLDLLHTTVHLDGGMGPVAKYLLGKDSFLCTREDDTDDDSADTAEEEATKLLSSYVDSSVLRAPFMKMREAVPAHLQLFADVVSLYSRIIITGLSSRVRAMSGVEMPVDVLLCKCGISGDICQRVVGDRLRRIKRLHKHTQTSNFL